MQRHVNVYSGTIVRGDANWQLADRIVAEPKYTALLAWVAVDGALYQPPTPAEREDLPSLLADLEPLVDRVKMDRLEAGLGQADACMVAHCTDSLRKHGPALSAFYARKYVDVGLQVDSATPKGASQGCSSTGASSFTEITADVQHDVINFRALVPASSPDASDAILDHQDALSRLSAPLPGGERASGAPLEDLPNCARDLLRTGIERNVVVFKDSLKQRPKDAKLLVAWLQQPGVNNSKEWKTLFRAMPPRGVVARLARRCGATLHESVGFFNFPTLKAFRKELKRIRGWYRKQKRQQRRLRGIVRSRRAPLHVFARKSIWTAKVRHHYKLLLRIRVPGMWAWRGVALDLHAAGIPVQAGTVAVERLWSLLSEMLPRAARRVSLRWFNLLCKVAFLRHNYTLYSQGSMPTWADKDPLLAQRIDALPLLLRVLADEQAPDVAHLLPIFEAFR
jgi:hypothetical protein